MEKINVAELLRNCPQGMELDCTIFNGKVCFEGIDNSNSLYPIKISANLVNIERLDIWGQYNTRDYAKCVIFPKGKTTWEGFHRPFVDGDVVTYKYENGLVSMLLDKFVNFVEVHYHCALYDSAKGFVTNNYIVGEPKYTRFATEEEKEKLFDAIKANGYKWNQDNKTLENVIEPRFKVGDRIKHKENGNVLKIVDIDMSDSNYCCGLDYIWIADQDKYELVPNKFDITTLVPFESKVLVRDYDNMIWVPTFWGKRLENDSNCNYLTINGCYKYCIPYEGNEHLIGKTDDCDEYFKTWE